jgi:hypothetical protein
MSILQTLLLLLSPGHAPAGLLLGSACISGATRYTRLHHPFPKRLLFLFCILDMMFTPTKVA